MKVYIHFNNYACVGSFCFDKYAKNQDICSHFSILLFKLVYIYMYF